MMGTGFPFGVMKKLWNYMVMMVSNTVNVLNATEVYILKCKCTDEM